MREALFLLAAEGLVESRPRVGFVVPPFDLLEIQQLLEVHLIIAKAVARLSLSRATPADMERLRAAALDVERAIDARAYAAIAESNARFHRLEAVATHNDLLQRIASSVHDRRQRLAHLSFSGYASQPHRLKQHFAKVREQHAATLHAMETHDADASERVAAAHVQLFWRHVQKYLFSDHTGSFTLSAMDMASIALVPPVREEAAIRDGARRDRHAGILQAREP